MELEGCGNGAVQHWKLGRGWFETYQEAGSVEDATGHHAYGLEGPGWCGWLACAVIQTSPKGGRAATSSGVKMAAQIPGTVTQRARVIQSCCGGWQCGTILAWV